MSVSEQLEQAIGKPPTKPRGRRKSAVSAPVESTVPSEPVVLEPCAFDAGDHAARTKQATNPYPVEDDIARHDQWELGYQYGALDSMYQLMSSGAGFQSISNNTTPLDVRVRELRARRNPSISA